MRLAGLAAVAFAASALAVERQPVDPAAYPRIVNGVLTHDYPAVGALLRGDFPDWAQYVPITADTATLFCSGTLIGCRTFLTAGHCTKTAFPTPSTLDADEVWVYLPHAGIFPVTSIARHPDYTLAALGVPINDVAVLKLGAPVTGIAPLPINLADPNPFIPAAGTIVGFGSTNNAGVVDKGLKRTGQVETATCVPVSPAPATQLVCWDVGEGSDTGPGDSGGPLLLDLGDGPVIAGVTSGGTPADGVAEPGHSFDANVYTYRDFILAELGSDDTTTCGGLPPVGDPQVHVFGFDGTLDDAAPSASHTVSVGTGAASVRITLNAEETVTRTAPQRTFDVNLYVRAGLGASPSDFDCAVDAASVYGACVFDQPTAGTYSIFVERAYGAGDYQVTATVFGSLGWAGAGVVSMVLVDPQTPTTLYAATQCSGVLKSFDSGESWHAMNNGLTNTYLYSLVIDPHITNTLYAGTWGNGVFKTIDGGATWSAAGLADGFVAALAIDPRTTMTLYAANGYAGGRHEVWKSTDGAATWVLASMGLPADYVSTIVVDPSAPEILYAGTGDGVYKSVDGAANWSPTGLQDTWPRVQTLVIDPVSPNTVYAATEGGGLFKTTDAGDVWTAINDGLPSSYPGYRSWALAIDPVSTSTLYAGTSDPDSGGQVLFKSIDAGATWNALNTGATNAYTYAYASALGISPSTPTTVYAGRNFCDEHGCLSSVLKSTDGGTTWHATTAALCGDGFVTCTEQCDDGNTVDGDGCEADCTLPRCGNAILDSGEQCDDGNLNPSDGCTNGCTICGDGIMTPPEVCDDGNLTDHDGCNADCQLPICGDGVRDPGEECDDGNLNPADGCTNACTICGNGAVTPPEACDDGNRVDTDACTNDCRLAVVTIGDGTAAGCTETALDAGLGAGRMLTFNCGNAPVTIAMTTTTSIGRDNIIDGGGVVTISGGGGDFDVFRVNPGITFEVRNLTIADGGRSGIFNDGTVKIMNSTVVGNAYSGVWNRCGGAATLINCTVSENGRPYVPAGGGILCGDVPGRGNDCGLQTDLTLTNCTISGNSAFEGGGIFGCIPGTATINNCTLSANSAVAGATNLAGSPTVNLATVTLTNTVIAGLAGENCTGQVVDGGHNLQWPGTDCGNTILSLDPLLDPDGLADNGGPTQTIALQAGSPAINAGDPEVCANPPVNGLDQRGYVRPGLGHTVCSIGAYEADACTGDCDGTGMVAINELILGVNIVLELQPIDACPAFMNADGMVDIAQLITAVNNALDGCGAG